MPSAVQAADEIWGDVFCEGPYTSVPMLDFLRRRYNLRHVDIMENKNCLRSLAETDSFRRDSTEDQLLGLWASRTGRCTSFAVKVVTILQRKFPGTFDFRFYDLEGRHRLARCSRTGILIDSGSLNGAFVLEEGDLTSFEDDGQSWRWCKGESTFKGVNYKGMPLKPLKSKTMISRKEAMLVCLKDVAARLPAVIIFRSYIEDVVRFHGMWSWKFAQKRLELVPNLHNPKQKFVIQWYDNGRAGDTDYHYMCDSLFIRFNSLYSGPYGEEQWTADGIDRINDIWLQYAFGNWGKLDLWTEGELRFPSDLPRPRAHIKKWG